jgi:hypothetical protein
VSRRILAAAVAVAALALGGTATRGQATTAPELLLNIDVALHAKTVGFTPKSARRGNYVQFRVTNWTAKRRTFRLAGRYIVVPARKARFIAVEFDRRGKYQYVSRATGSTVKGIFKVE